jgi:hypothetical protein
MNGFMDKVILRGKDLAQKGGSKAFSPFSGKGTSKSKVEIEPKSASITDLGESHGQFKLGTASGSGLNCLIDSIGKALGINPSATKREEIRKMLIDLKLAKKNEFLYNDQPILSAILQGLGRRPGDANIFFITGDSTVVDNQTYNMGARNTIYIHNADNVHFSPMIRQQ